VNGPEAAIIDCEEEGQGFIFTNGEAASSVLEGFTIKNDLNFRGGGVYCEDTSPTILNCIFTDNTARGEAIFWPERENRYRTHALGGAIYCLNSAIRIDGCAFTRNEAFGNSLSVFLGAGLGDAVYCENPSPVITNCTINKRNWAIGEMLGNQTASFRAEPAKGAGLCFVSCSVSLSNCTIANNITIGGGGSSERLGFAGDGQGGGIYLEKSTADIRGTTMNNNDAIAGLITGGLSLSPKAITQARGFGGGICSHESDWTLVNCTISGNSVEGRAGGRRGAGIYHSTGMVDVINCTIAENDVAEFGGGIEVGMGTVYLLNTLLSNNDAENLSGETIISEGYNLSSDDSVLLDGSKDLVNTDPLLGPLQDNGGPTWTHVLLPGSPALDAGTTVGAPATDQRGSPRPFGRGIDIGHLNSSPTFG